MNEQHQLDIPHPALLLALTAGLAACQPYPTNECRRADDCATGEFCRMGFCVPAIGRDRDTRADSPRGSTVVDVGSRRVDPTEPDVGATNKKSKKAQPEGCTRGRTPRPDDLVINEVLANVPPGPDGDANGDGVRDAFDDEFVEIVNRSNSVLDLDDVAVVEGQDPKTTLDGLCLPPQTALLVFGGLASGDAPTAPDGAMAVVADKRLGFSNAGGRVALLGPDDTPVAQATWNDPPGQSLTLRPQLTGTDYVLHEKLADDQPFSPGRCPDGSPLADGCPPPKTPPDAGLATDTGGM